MSKLETEPGLAVGDGKVGVEAEKPDAVAFKRLRSKQTYLDAVTAKADPETLDLLWIEAIPQEFRGYYTPGLLAERRRQQAEAEAAKAADDPEAN